MKMGAYENYLGKIKNLDPGQVDINMHARIESKIQKNRLRARYMALAMLFLALFPFAFYFTSRSPVYLGQDTLAEYVIQQDDPGEDAIINYVFLD